MSRRTPSSSGNFLLSASVTGVAGNGSSPRRRPNQAQHQSPTPAAEAISAMRSARATARWSGTDVRIRQLICAQLGEWPY